MEVIVLKPDPAQQVNPGLEPGWVEEKIGEGKTWQDLVKNPIATR
jgi:hypothetical protein